SYLVEPATVPDVSWAGTLAAGVYSGMDIIPEPLMLAWYEKNSTGFSIIRSKLGAPVGNVDLLPIRSDVLASFVAGRLSELDISAECLYQPPERQQIADLYVESLVS